MTTYSPLPRPEYYARRISVNVPASFDAAVRSAARRLGLSVSDYVRLAAAERATRDGVEVPRLPITSNSNFQPQDAA